MLQKSEEKLINLIRLGPLLSIIFSVIVIFLIIDSNNNYVQQQLDIAKQESLLENKAMIKREVQSVHSYIENELKRAREDIKEDIKSRVYEAFNIANSIYEKNRDKDDKLIQKLIIDALREIRFNDSRGYFFIYELNGKNVMLPTIPKLEGKSLWEFKDKKGLYVLKEINKILSKQDEEFLTWWWTRPNGSDESFEKIGFVKDFKHFKWFIGTGEYVVDYENALKKELLKRIGNIRFGKNGYIFIVDDKGTTLSHIEKRFEGLNRLDLEDKNGVKITRELIKAAKKGEDFVSYAIIQPTTGKETEKLSFVKGFEKWGWAIGTGVYLEELDSEIKKKNDLITESNKSQFKKILLISLILFLFLFIASMYLARLTKDKFLAYNIETKESAQELEKLNDTLEHRVEDAIKDLKLTQNKLIEAEKMSSLGVLVSGVAHEINTPIGIGLTGSSHLLELTEKIEQDYKEHDMSKEEFENYLESSKELSTLININLERTAQLVKNFKKISFDQSSEEKRDINLKEYIDEVIFSMGSIIRKSNLTVKNSCDENINITTYPGAISQIITNLIINSIRHGFKEKEEGAITIEGTIDEKLVKLVYSDTGKGIEEEVLPKIFDPFFTTNRENGGTGLGLNILYNIISNSLHGSIDCKSEKDKGVKFIISFTNIV